MLFLQEAHSPDCTPLDSNPLPSDYETRALTNVPPGTTQTVSVSRILEASYEICPLIAKGGKNHTMVEDLAKPSITAFLRTVLEKDDNAVTAVPPSNNTVSKRID